MKTLRVLGKANRDGDYNIRSVREVETGLEVDTPSLLVNLLHLRKKLAEPKITPGFKYVFPFAFDPALETNGFKVTFPLIFE